jgi:nicotinamidase-related amidase
LDRLLANHGVDTCVVAGGLLAGAVTETARTGATLGYRMYLAADAVFPPLETYPWTTQGEVLPTTALVDALAAGECDGAARDRHALVVVDMQNHFLYPGGEGQNNSPHATVIENVAALASALRARDWPVIWVKTGRRRDRADSAMHRLREAHLQAKGELLYDGTWAAALAAGLDPQPADVMVVKRGASAFGFTPLHRILRNLEVAHCVVTGGAATGCLASTARDAAALGYRVTVVPDAVYPAASPYLRIIADYGALRPTAALLSSC